MFAAREGRQELPKTNIGYFRSKHPQRSSNAVKEGKKVKAKFGQASDMASGEGKFNAQRNVHGNLPFISTNFLPLATDFLVLQTCSALACCYAIYMHVFKNSGRRTRCEARARI